MITDWQPKAGDPVVYTAAFTFPPSRQGKPACVQLMRVTKVTPSGYIYLDRQPDSKFLPAKDGVAHEYTPKRLVGLSTISSIRLALPDEVAILPTNGRDGSRYAEELRKASADV